MKTAVTTRSRRKEYNLLRVKKVNINITKQIALTPSKILETVCLYRHVPISLVMSKTRKREVVQTKQIAIYFSKILTKNKEQQIAEKIGGNDRTLVYHSIKTVNNLMETDKRFRLQIEEIGKRLKN